MALLLHDQAAVQNDPHQSVAVQSVLESSGRATPRNWGRVGWESGVEPRGHRSVQGAQSQREPRCRPTNLDRMEGKSILDLRPAFGQFIDLQRVLVDVFSKVGHVFGTPLFFRDPSVLGELERWWARKEGVGGQH